MKSILNRIAIVLFAASVVSPVFAQGKAADTYKTKCAMCHGADGLGATPAGKMMKAASFKDPAVANASDAALIAAVTHGKNKMPAYQGKLTDAEIKAVIDYVRTLER